MVLVEKTETKRTIHSADQHISVSVHGKKWLFSVEGASWGGRIWGSAHHSGFMVKSRGLVDSKVRK